MVTLWCYSDSYPKNDGEVWFWQRFVDGNANLSIPRYLEDHAEELREKYIACIHDIGEYKIKGRCVVEHLDAGDGFSYWWMGLLAEKSPFKSPKLYDCLRLLALEAMLVNNKPAQLALHTDDHNLATSIRVLCENLHISFSCFEQKKHHWNSILAIRSLYKNLPYMLQGLISLRHVVGHWRLRKLDIPTWCSGDNSIFFCSNFFNWDTDLASVGDYYARQWAGLPKHLQSHGARLNWIHHFIDAPSMPKENEGIEWLHRFNVHPLHHGNHVFLQSYLSWRVMCRTLIRWCRLNIARFRLITIRDAFMPYGSSVWLWPLLKDDWKTSMSGSVAMMNCLWIELFDTLFRQMPHQDIGLYLWENQGWESAMIQMWKKHGHGRIIGVPHATISFWHMNNFDDSRTLNRDQCYAKPLPDQLAVNGAMAWGLFEMSGYLVERMVEVEASRFQYLRGIDDQRQVTDEGKEHRCRVLYTKRLLVLGDFRMSQTRKMMRCVEQALLALPATVFVTVKLHPVCRLDPSDFPSFTFAAVDADIGDLMVDSDLAFVGNSTSAGLDALLAGLFVAVFLDPEDFNHSPLRGGKGVCFVDSANELEGFLRSAGETRPSIPSVEDFFWLDKSFSKWNRLVFLHE